MGANSSKEARHSASVPKPKNKVGVSTTESSREYHSDETSTYWLPKDDEEQQRLTGQHYALKEMYGSNVLSCVESGLDFKKGVSVLDVGCGSGIWLTDMLFDYPNCNYHGCDMVDTTNKNLKLNFKLKVGNIINGLPYKDNTFDLVHIRLFVFALSEDQWPLVIKELLRVVKKGGFIQIAEVDLKMTEEQNRPFHKLLTAVHKVCKQRNQNPRIALEIERLVSKNENARVLASDYRSCNMSGNNCTAKKLSWDWVELTKGILPWINPFMGLKSPNEVQEFLQQLKHCLENSDCFVYFNIVAAQKITPV
ncbi:S-adenosyl-L-methionine-dependent methyltransferase [Sporodiniella umbellata]|nr:S-adenosyl-L-methionine-dependent methyltransferase [Sporodiniella umbellata]